MATTELLHPLRQRRAFRSSVKINEPSVFIVCLLSLPLAAAKSLAGKGVVKFLVCILVILYILFSTYYPAWLALQSDTNTKQSIDQVPLCPCHVGTTWDENQLGFNADPACDARKSGYWNCRFHQGAKGCYRRKSATSAAGAQCCYDINGKWITDWRKGAGTLDFYYPETWRNVSTYQHFFSDVLSYFSCCIGVTMICSSCEQYMKYRPAGKCENISLSRACGNNDLNLSTFEEILCRSNRY